MADVSKIMKKDDEKQPVEDDVQKLYVGNIPENCSTHQLEELFAKHGKVKRADIVKNYAFVFIHGRKAAEDAMSALHNTTFDGKQLTVQISRNKMNLPEAQNACFECGKDGHWARECPRRRPPRGRSPPHGYGDQLSAQSASRGFERTIAPQSFDRGAFAARDVYGRDPYGRDPYGRDPYGRDAYMRSQIPREAFAQPAFPSRERSPVRGTSFADPYAAERERLAYGRAAAAAAAVVPADPYKSDPYAASYAAYARDPYASRYPYATTGAYGVTSGYGGVTTGYGSTAAYGTTAAGGAAATGYSAATYSGSTGYPGAPAYVATTSATYTAAATGARYADPYAAARRFPAPAAEIQQRPAF